MYSETYVIWISELFSFWSRKKKEMPEQMSIHCLTAWLYIQLL